MSISQIGAKASYYKLNNAYLDSEWFNNHSSDDTRWSQSDGLQEAAFNVDQRIHGLLI